MINMKETLMSCIENQLTHLDTVDTKELGEAIDMVKDLSEAIYYCTITKAMLEREEEQRYYSENYMPDYRMTDRDWGKMYYTESSHNSMTHTSHTNGKEGPKSGHHTEWEVPFGVRDDREGRSYMSRKTYMESKEMHQDKNVKLRDLEKYMQELTTDIVEMIQGASPEEKQLLEKRVAALATKIGQVNV
jgi:hypothetical protein